MEFTAKIDSRDILKFHIQSIVESLRAKPIKTLVLPFGIAIYVGIRTGASAGDPMIGLFYTVAILGSMLFFVALLYFGMILAKSDENQPIGSVRYTFSETGVTIDTSSRNDSFTWSDLTNSGKSENFIWMQFSDRHYRFIPRSAVDDERLFDSAWGRIEQYGAAA